MQRLEMDGITIAPDFVDNKTLACTVRTSTLTELEELLEVHWLSPKSGRGNAIWCAPVAIVPSQAA